MALATDDPKEILKSETVKMWSDWMERLNIYSDNESLSTIPLCEEDNRRYCLLRKLRVPFVPKNSADYFARDYVACQKVP